MSQSTSFWLVYGGSQGPLKWPGFTLPGGLKLDRPIHRWENALISFNCRCLQSMPVLDDAHRNASRNICLAGAS